VSGLFLDASGWLSALDRRETRHADAIAAYQLALTSRHRIVTTNLVVAEVHVLLMRRGGTRFALRFFETTMEDPALEVVHSDRELEAAAADRWLRRYQDHDISLADAVSFEVMRRERIERALTLDRHFAAAGFEML
jgi:uncharacterized protein